jgi:hypothetical protein
MSEVCCIDLGGNDSVMVLMHRVSVSGNSSSIRRADLYNSQGREQELTDEEIKESIKRATETCIESSSAMAMLLRDAFCVLAEQPGVDRQAVLDGLRSLTPVDDESVLFQATYKFHKARLLEKIEVLYKEKS